MTYNSCAKNHTSFIKELQILYNVSQIIFDCTFSMKLIVRCPQQIFFLKLFFNFKKVNSIMPAYLYQTSGKKNVIISEHPNNAIFLLKVSKLVSVHILLKAPFYTACAWSLHYNLTNTRYVEQPTISFSVLKHQKRKLNPQMLS